MKRATTALVSNFSRLQSKVKSIFKLDGNAKLDSEKKLEVALLLKLKPFLFPWLKIAKVRAWWTSVQPASNHY